MDKKELKSLVKTVETSEWTKEIIPIGNRIELPIGVTSYELKGEGELFVLVHGYATPYFIYDRVFEQLLESGYKVLRYDLLGRGLSERIEGDYTPELFCKQLEQLLEKLNLKESFYLVGTSMGGIITSTYSAKHQDRIKALILLAPAGMPYEAPFYMKMCLKKHFGNFIYKLIGGKTLLKKCASEMKYSTDRVDYYVKSMANTTKYKGFIRCTLSSMRNSILNFEESVKGYQVIGRTNMKVLAIWGTADRTMPYYLSQKLLSFVPQAQLITYQGSGHIFVYDEGERTVKDILTFLEK